MANKTPKKGIRLRNIPALTAPIDLIHAFQINIHTVVAITPKYKIEPIVLLDKENGP